MQSPILGFSSPQAGYSVNDTGHPHFVEVSKQHTPVTDLGAVRQPEKHSSFIRTVPMQHVQSHYAEQWLDEDSAPAKQPTANMQPFFPDKAWLTQLTAPAFLPLVSLSPESSCSSVGQPEHLVRTS